MHNNTKYIDGKVLILQQKQPNRQSLISNLQKNNNYDCKKQHEKNIHHGIIPIDPGAECKCKDSHHR